MTAMMDKFSEKVGMGKELKLRRLSAASKDCTSYTEWRHWAEQEDLRTGKAEWRERDKTPLYDYRAIQRRYRRLKDLREEGNARGLLFSLHEGVHGNMAGMGSEVLYNQSMVGTKRLIEDYIDEIVTCLQFIDGVDDSVISREEKQAFFNRVDHCFGRSALMLSGGAVNGFFHYGVVKALLEQGVLPSVISGSSAGSMTAAVVGTHTDEELKGIFNTDFLLSEPQAEPTFLERVLNPRGQKVSDQKVAENLMSIIPDITFEEAFKKTGRHINIPIAPARRHQTSRLLNSITSPNVLIRSAVQASCAVPGILEPVQLRAKNFSGGKQDYLPGRKWVDGSMDDDLPAKRLSRLYGVNHYIASQVNPYVLPFLTRPEGKNIVNAVLNPYKIFAKETIKSIRSLDLSSSLPLPQNVRQMEDIFYAVATQKYTSDISIIYDGKVISPFRLLSMPTEKEVTRLIEAGERSTWPMISRIDNSTKISRAVEAILARYQPSI